MSSSESNSTTMATPDGHAASQSATGARDRMSQAGALLASPRLRPAAIALAVLALGWYLLAADGNQRHLRDARIAAAQGDFPTAIRLAQESGGSARGQAQYVEALSLQGEGRLHDADLAFSKAVALSPNSFEIRRDWAILLARAGLRQRAQRQLAAALALNPDMPAPLDFRRRG